MNKESMVSKFRRFLRVIGAVLLFFTAASLIAFAIIGTINKVTEAIRAPGIQAERQEMERFLADHGDVVTVIASHDEFKKVSSGKYGYRIDGHVWLTCKFEDGYAIDVEQHRQPIARFPLEGERWRLRIYTNDLNSVFYFYERVEVPSKSIP